MTAEVLQQSKVSNFSGEFDSNRDQWNGNTIGTFHYHGNPSATKPPPRRAAVLLPFRRDRDFVDRDVLTTVSEKCAEPAARVALVGLGGVGKSQLAIEYAYRFREANPDVWIFWVHASNLARFQESYRDIAHLLKIPNWDNFKQDFLRLVKSYLSDEANGKWLMIVDNADDTNVVLEAADDRPSLQDYIPTSSHGAVLVTSRNRDVATGLIEYEEDILDITPMTPNEAVRLAKARIKKGLWEGQSKVIEDLVKQLDFMPLAITQAVGYINQRAPLVTINKYLEDLNRGESNRNRLLLSHLRDPRRDKSASNSILLTWHMTLSYLQSARPSCTRLLALMSMFDRESIMAKDIRNNYQADDDSVLEDDIATLRSYNLIGMSDTEKYDSDPDSVTFEMHRLVQSSMKLWLEMQNELRLWEVRFVLTMADEFPTSTFENWPVCRRLLPHVESMAKIDPLADEVSSVMADWWRVIFEAGRFVLKTGRYADAELMFRKALEPTQQRYGRDDRRTLDLISTLAHAISSQGKYKEADALFREAIEIADRTLAQEDGLSLQVKNDASLHMWRGERYTESETLIREVLRIHMETLGEEHRATLINMHNLGCVLKFQGKYVEAETMCKKAILGFEREGGKRDPDRCIVMTTMTSVLILLNRSEEALAIGTEATEILESLLGPTHPETLQCKSNLASVLMYQRRFDEAYPVIMAVVESAEVVVGRLHPETLTKKDKLGIVLRLRQMYPEAEKVYREVIRDREIVLGAHHEDYLATTYGLSLMMTELGRHDEAEVLLKRAQAGYEKLPNSIHPDKKNCERAYAEFMASSSQKSAEDDGNINNAETIRMDDSGKVSDSLKTANTADSFENDAR